MKKNKKVRKLRLSRETIKVLHGPETRKVLGALDVSRDMSCTSAGCPKCVDV